MAKRFIVKFNLRVRNYDSKIINVSGEEIEVKGQITLRVNIGKLQIFRKFLKVRNKTLL